MNDNATPRPAVRGLAKHSTLHLRGGPRLQVLDDTSLDGPPGECIARVGPSGPGPACAVIMKRVDERTRAKTSINELLRD